MNSPTPRIVAKQPRRNIYVKVRYDDQIKRIPGTAAREEQGPGSLVVFDGLEVVARFWGDVERWWIEEP
jgi:hypothetical protein